MDDCDLSTSTTTEGPAYECCEMKIAAFVGLGCVMAVFLVFVLIWFFRRKRLTKQYKLNKQTPKMSASQTQRYASVQQDNNVCQGQTSETLAGNDVPNDAPPPPPP